MKKKLLVLLMSFMLGSPMTQAEIVERNVQFFNGELKFGGTLTLPDTTKNYPVILLVSGSGQQNRDEEIYGFKIFKQIADYLAGEGIATLRYDDREVGESKNGKNTLDTATTYTFATDAMAAVKYLKTAENVDKSRIAVLGHSEGGLIAAMVAAENPKDIKCIAMMSGMCIAGKDINNFQIRAINKEAGISDAQIAKALQLQNMIYEAIEQGKSGKDMEDVIYDVTLKSIDLMPEEAKKDIVNGEEYARFVAKNQTKQIASAWYRYYVTHYPKQDFEKVQCPTLAMFGLKDTQVPAQLCKRPMQSYFSNRGKLLTIIEFPTANHLFQDAETGSVSEYPKLKKEFTSSFFKHLGEWLKVNL